MVVTDVFTFGEAMGRLSSTVIGPLRHSPSLALGVAGAEMNVAIGVARLGLRSRWTGRVGEDEFGRLITATLRGEGVTTNAIVQANASTGLLIKEHRTARASKVLYYRDRSAGSRLNPADIDEEEIGRSAILHVTGITAGISESARRAVEQAVEIAHDASTLVSFDVNYRSALWTPAEAREKLRPIASRADILFAGVAEARVLVDGPDESELAFSLAALGPKEVVMKRGARGAFVLVGGTRYEAPVFRVEEVDAVGAGDAFTAGYLAERISGGSPESRLKLAAACGALVASAEGDWEGLPTRAELSLLLDDEQVTR